jgi:hypothetical protein
MAICWGAMLIWQSKKTQGPRSRLLLGCRGGAGASLAALSLFSKTLLKFLELFLFGCFEVDDLLVDLLALSDKQLSQVEVAV